MSEPERAKGSPKARGMWERAVRPGRGSGMAAERGPYADPSQLATAAIAKADLAQAPEDAPRSPSRPAWRARLTTMAAVSAGGFLGANARYLVGLWAADRWGAAFPWGTFLINVSGSFVLGFYLTLVTERFIGRSATRLFVATGFLGAYTTFSTLSYEAVQLVAAGAVLPALAYVLGSLLLGIAAAVAGILAAHAL